MAKGLEQGQVPAHFDLQVFIGHMFEQSGRLLVPRARVNSWYIRLSRSRCARRCRTRTGQGWKPGRVRRSARTRRIRRSSQYSVLVDSSAMECFAQNSAPTVPRVYSSASPLAPFSQNSAALRFLSDSGHAHPVQSKPTRRFNRNNDCAVRVTPGLRHREFQRHHHGLNTGRLGLGLRSSLRRSAGTVYPKEHAAFTVLCPAGHPLLVMGKSSSDKILIRRVPLAKGHIRLSHVSAIEVFCIR